MEEFRTELSVVEDYLLRGKYPGGFSKTEKANLRRKCRNNFMMDKGVLHYRKNSGGEKNGNDWRICIRSEEEKTRVLESCHSGVAGSHLGRDKTLEKITSRFFWRNMNEEIRQFVQNCDKCQRVNPKFVKSNAKLHPIPVQAKVWHQVGIDLIGPLPQTKKGNKYIVTLVDYFSKWPEAAPLPDKTADGVALFLYELFCRFGCCEVIISDQGREFVNKVKAELLQLSGTEHRVTSAYHPQTNGLTERFNQTLQTALIKVVNDTQDDWDEHLSAVLFAYRTAQQKATKMSPFEVMFCRKPMLPVEMECLEKERPLAEDKSGTEWDTDDIVQHAEKMAELKEKIHSKAKLNIDRAQEKDKIYYDRKHADPKVLTPGTLVLLKNSARESKKGDKMKPRWNGPYKIHSDLGKGVYRLCNPKTGNVLKKAVNTTRLKIYLPDKSDPPHISPPQDKSGSPPPSSPPTIVIPDVDSLPTSPISVDEDAPTPEKVKNPAWIRSLELFQFDRDVLIDGKELSDALIDAGQKLLKKKYPHINGLQSSTLSSLLQFDPTPTRAVQIHHTGGHHWLCTTSIGAGRGEVLVMDSLAMQVPMNRSMILQMAQIYRVPDKRSSFSIKVLPVQQQSGYRDCGLFAIAFATDICRGQDPTESLYIQTQMRGHLFKCITTGNMMPFPQFPKQERATLPPLMTLHPKVNTRNVKVYCVCRMPDHYDRKMIECEECEQWFHYSCMGLSRKAAIPEVWKCGSCTKRQVTCQKPMEFQTKFPAAKRQRLL